ncbi:MAG: energy-coupling factor transporter ATPase [Oscillospiraceae bacterium]|nr:energy-coupling factor transporter ATPase [Oscillospiraceae bacterium]
MYLSTENLTHTYGAGTPFERRALDGVNFSVELGEMRGIIGHTGSGKSTLIQHLNGLLKPGSGRVLLDGKDVWEGSIRELRFKVGLVFQYPEYQLFEETVAADIAFGPKNMGLQGAELETRVDEALAFVGLDESVKTKSPFDLSGGQKRRAAIAGVIAMRPQVLILDEPTAGLDPRGRDALLERIKSYHRERGGTVILVTHSMDELAKTVDSVTVMSKANILLEGTPREVFGQADVLERHGLTVPGVTAVFRRLAAMGVDVDPSVLTVDEGVKSLLVLKNSQGGDIS